MGKSAAGGDRVRARLWVRLVQGGFEHAAPAEACFEQLNQEEEEREVEREVEEKEEKERAEEEETKPNKSHLVPLQTRTALIDLQGEGTIRHSLLLQQDDR